MSGRIVVVGSVNMDLMVRCERLPAPGETVIGRDFARVPGGKGANQAVAVARLGGTVSFVGAAGEDDFGNEALQALAKEGVDVSQARPRSGLATGVAVVLVEATGENSIAVAPGANAAFLPVDADDAGPLIAGAAMLVCQLETPLASVRRAIGIAAERGVTVLLNPAPAQALPDELLRQVDVLVPNASEAAILCGHAVASVDEAGEAAAALRLRGARSVVVTLGGQGAVVVDGAGRTHVPAALVPVVDTTGAGDTFIGALAVALTEGHGLRKAVALAQRAAGYSVGRHGAQASMPRRVEVDWP